MSQFLRDFLPTLIAGRYLGENTRIVYDIMHSTEQNDMPGLLLQVDFEKAFDSISRFFKVLEFYGFGNSIISWIKKFFIKMLN